MTKIVKIDDNTYEYVTSQAKYKESFADALTRLFGH